MTARADAAQAQPAQLADVGPLITIAEAAGLARCQPVTIRRWISSGRLRAIRVGRFIRVREADLLALFYGDSGGFWRDCWRA